MNTPNNIDNIPTVYAVADDSMYMRLAKVAEHIEAHIEQCSDQIILDLRGNFYIDSACFGRMLKINTMVKHRNKHIQFVVEEAVLTIIRLSDLDKIISVVTEV